MMTIYHLHYINHVNCNNYAKSNSGIIMSDISDHIPIVVYIGTKQKTSKKPLSNAENGDKNQLNLTCYWFNSLEYQ